jgi:hypothetical protein
VFLENDESVDRIRQHVADYGLTIPVVRDPSRNLARLAGVTVTPEVAVFSFHHGRPHLVYRGRIDDQYAELGKPRPAPTTHDLEEVLARTGRGEPVLFHATRAVGCFISDIQ